MTQIEKKVDGRERLTILSDKDLLGVQKPAQYLGGELNSVTKSDSEVDLNFALAFPDTYEVGMSHIGLQLLYELINSDEKAWAERVFMPLADMEELHKGKNITLSSLESRRALCNFDIVGFSLQYELCGTNILAMLELGNIPRKAEARTEADPLIIGGGPYSYHPEPFAPFFDAFLLGDAEEAIFEILEAVRSAKEGNLSRVDMLKALANIDGVYVPSHFQPVYDETGRLLEIESLNENRTSVEKRLLPSLEGAPYVEKPLVPNIKTIHNRLSVEVMRGCVRGCRFCQAGYLYRPQRERSPEEILDIVGNALPKTGFEELSLLSLSTADYCSIVPLLKQLMDIYGEGDTLAISFPSTRVDSLTPEVLSQVQRVRRTGFTIAPEAGTQRLRDVINKGVSDEEILETCSNVFTMGWTGIKLYFMLGLPTETDEDLHGIIDIARRVRKLPEAAGKNITVSVSTHVPKPHTPFQWAKQISREETVRKQRLLAEGLRDAKVNFRYHDAFSSFLEGVFSRGDRDIAKVLERAYELGSRLDAWTEHLSEEIWMQAFLDCDIDPSFYHRERTIDEVLPWDHLSASIPKSYFAKEYKRALRHKESPDCLTKSCTICGACDYDVAKNVLWPRAETEKVFDQISNRETGDKVVSFEEHPVSRLRLCYRKQGAFRFVGHLELAQTYHRALRRASIPVAFSKGFHPLPRLAFGPPLTVGIESETEFVDIFLTQDMSPELLIRFLNEALPDDIRVLSANPISLKANSIQDSVAEQVYEAIWISEPAGLFTSLDASNVDSATGVIEKGLKTLTITRESKNKKRRGPRPSVKRTPTKEYRVSDYVRNVSVSETGFTFTLFGDIQAGLPKPTEIVKAIADLELGDYQLKKLSTTLEDKSAEFSKTHPETFPEHVATL